MLQTSTNGATADGAAASRMAAWREIIAAFGDSSEAAAAAALGVRSSAGFRKLRGA